MLSLSKAASTGIRRAIGSQVRARPLPGTSLSFSTSTLLRTADSPGRLTGLPSYGPVGVARVVHQTNPLKRDTLAPTIFTHEFALTDRVALVSGANRGIGLEMALALVEAGARTVYCVDLPKTPSQEWAKVSEFAKRLPVEGSGQTPRGGDPEARLKYVSADVRDQEAMWRVGKTIGDQEGRMDACVAAAGTLAPEEMSCLTYSAKMFQEVLDVNVNGALFTAQAAGQQMERFGSGGSIVMLASVSGHAANKGYAWTAYNTSKSAVLQMARSMACELGPKGIRVNSISPGAIKTPMIARFISTAEAEKAWAEQHPLGRVGRPDELRGIAVWLASDASSFCTGSDFFVSGGYHAW